MAKLSDAKFIHAETESAPAKRKLNAQELAPLRGAFDPHYREVMAAFPEAQGHSEPVSFMHPESRQRVYGWLVAKTAEGHGRVEIGDGEYAIVPARDLRRVGEADTDLIEVRSTLKRAYQQTKLAATGYRKDLVETSAPQQIDAEDYVVSLRYAAAYGPPTENELWDFVERNYPGMSVMHVEVPVTERVDLGLRIAKPVEAEMDAAVGGELIETITPTASDDVNNDADSDMDGTEVIASKEAQTQKSAWSPWELVDNETKDFLNAKVPPTSPKEVAAYLAKSPKEAAKFIEAYVRNGGAAAMAKLSTNYNTQTLLEAAVPVVQKINSTLYNSVARQVGVAAPGQAPAQSGQAVPTQVSGNPASGNSTVSNPTVSNATVSNAPTQVGQHYSQQPTQTAPGGQVTPGQPGQTTQPGQQAPFGQPDPNHPLPGMPPQNRFPKGSAKKRIANIRKGADAKKDKSYGLQVSVYDLEETMELKNLQRHGEYVVGTVTWDKGVASDMDATQMKFAVRSFVETKLTQGLGLRFGAWGQIHVTGCDMAKGKASVEFVTESAGSVPTTVVESDD